MANLVFKKADDAKAAITDSARKEIAALYSKWSDEIGKKAEYYKTKTNASSWLQEMNMRQLQAQLDATSKHIANEVNGIVKDTIYQVSDAVVQANNDWLIKLGFPATGVESAFVSVPDQTVRRLITGQIYESGWSLSKSIWSDNEDTLKKLYEIVAQGLAQNMTAYDISKLLEQYVDPSRAKQWNLKMADGKNIYKKSVDYNAQRLARTLAQHGYQTSVIALTEKNPFIIDIIWRANGSRVCELCEERDGQHFPKNDLPLDHPNGMCTMEPAVDPDLTDKLADWINSPDGTFPEIDEFAKQFGYFPSSDVVQNKTSETFEKMSQQQYLEWQVQHSTREQLDKQIEDEFGIKLRDGQLSFDDDRFIESGPYQGMWLQDIVEKNTDLLSTVERSYGCGYVKNADGSKAINTYWRTGKVGRMYSKSEILETSNALDQLIQSTQINQPVSVDRWAGAKSLERMGINVAGTEGRIGHAFVTDMDAHDIAEQINSKLTGAIIEDKAYMSASMQSELNVFRGSDVRYVIEVPSGTNAFITDNTKESEVVFARGTKQEILGARVAQAEAYDYEGKPTTRQIVEITVRIISQ